MIQKLDDTDKLLTEYDSIEVLLDEYGSSDGDMFLNITDTDCRVMQSDSIT
ncbi:MAG: hypothetical protein SVZ03_02325 [Spirochaetota bacterium]|nr:hypothetical protein [Spirochaetota bacterium]